MKAFVFDYGYAGAEIFFAETDEEGINHHRAQQAHIAMMEIDSYKRGGLERDKVFIKNAEHRLEYIKSDDFADSVEIYDVVSGLCITTEGE